MMQWLIGIALRFVDSAMQRAIAPGNRLQTLGGIAGGAGIYAAMEYMETQMGCNFGELKLAALIPAIQGASATGNGQTVPKVLAKPETPSAGDQAHIEQGGNSL